MIKPSGCLGCPMYGDGQGFVPDEHVKGADTLVLLQNPGAEEERKGIPAIGKTGELLNESLLGQGGLTRGENVSVGNALRCRLVGAGGKHTNDMPQGKALVDSLAHCRQYDNFGHYQFKVACGSVAWRALGQKGSITDWRGHLSPDSGSGQVLATLHPADLFRDPKMKLPTLRDWSKIREWKAGTWPKQIPPVKQVPYTSSVGVFCAWADAWSHEYVVVDTEYQVATKALDLLGLGYHGYAGYQIWWRRLDMDDQAAVRDALSRLFARVCVVFQNSFADIPILERNIGLTFSFKAIEDIMLAHAVLWSDWPHSLKFLTSMYGQYPKMKHMAKADPSLYNWGDVLETSTAHIAISRELLRDPLSATVFRTQSLPLVPILLRTMAKGLRVNTPRIVPAIQEYQNQMATATLKARAACGWDLNLGSEKQLKKYLYEQMGYKVRTAKHTKKASVSKDSMADLAREIKEAQAGLSELEQAAMAIAGINGDDVVDARIAYATAQQTLSHYLLPLQGKSRIYPQFKIHAQASGRWSITDPPMAQIPPDLRDIVLPDEGEMWIGWDWDQIELRILAALAQDEPYLEAFKQKWDVHTINACDLFDLPKPQDLVNPAYDTAWAIAYGWMGKDDPRRKFGKTFVYRLHYGGDPRTAGDIPGARVLGLNATGLVRASQRYLAAHPQLASWRQRTALEARTQRVSRTFLGRRRRLLSPGPGAVREAYDHPMQGAVSDILNVTTIAIAEQLSDACLAYTMHDSAWWAVPVEKAETYYPIIRGIVEKEWDVQGQMVAIPATFKWAKDDGSTGYY